MNTCFCFLGPLLISPLTGLGWSAGSLVVMYAQLPRWEGNGTSLYMKFNWGSAWEKCHKTRHAYQLCRSSFVVITAMVFLTHCKYFLHVRIEEVWNVFFVWVSRIQFSFLVFFSIDPSHSRITLALIDDTLSPHHRCNLSRLSNADLSSHTIRASQTAVNMRCLQSLLGVALTLQSSNLRRKLKKHDANGKLDNTRGVKSVKQFTSCSCSVSWDLISSRTFSKRCCGMKKTRNNYWIENEESRSLFSARCCH